MGDLGVIALFGTPHSATLPLLIYQQLGAYMIPHATGTALLLLVLSLTVFWGLERVIGGKTDA
jgi:thiamine transport system permease protein